MFPRALGNTPPQRLRHAYDMVKVSSYCLWLLRCSYECLSSTSLFPSKHSHATSMASFRARHVYSLVQDEKLGGHSSFSTSSGPASCQVFLCWSPASFAALQPILSSPSLAEFEPRHGFQGLWSLLHPIPSPTRCVQLRSALCPRASSLEWQRHGHIPGACGNHYHPDEQPLPAVDGQSPETATVLRGKGFSIWKCSTRNCRAGSCCVVASGLCLIPHLGSARGTLYVFKFQPRPARCLCSFLYPLPVKPSPTLSLVSVHFR